MENSPPIPQTVPIGNLPAEVLVMINKYLSDVDRLSFRSVCKQVHNRLTPFIFDEVQVVYLPSSFKNLVKISTSPLLEYVTTLNYFGHIRPGIPRTEWEEHILPPSGVELPTHPKIPDFFYEKNMKSYLSEVQKWMNSSKPTLFYSAEQLDAGFQAYNAMVNAVDTFKYTFIDFTSIATAIKGLKHLKSITVTTNNLSPSYASTKVSRSADLIGFSKEPGVNLSSSTTSRLYVLYGIRQTSSILLAIFSSLPKLENLEFFEIFWSVIETHFERGIVVGAFSNLKSLSLVVNDVSDRYVSDAPSTEVSRKNILARALKSAKGLEKLWLYFRRTDDENVFQLRETWNPVLCSEIFLNNTWPELRDLTLTRVDMEPSFIDFFSHHSKLKKLNLEDIYLVASDDNESWFKMLHDMKKVVELNAFDVEGTFVWSTGWKQLTCEEGSSPVAKDTEIYDEVEGRTAHGWAIGKKLISDWFVENGPAPFPENGPAKVV